MFQKNEYSLLAILVLFLCFSLLVPLTADAQCVDSDGDGFFAGEAVCPTALDCDDTDPKVFPGAQRICDGKDNDCNGRLDFKTDVDKDGDGFLLCGGDCNDSDPNIFPGATEMCDGVDNNCDRILPSDERDVDGDGFRLCDPVPDCDDFDAGSNPGQPEKCMDGFDNDCDGSIDEDLPGDQCVCPDNDGDGQEQTVCGGTDCNDSDDTVFEGAPELCSDGKDNDCDGIVDIKDSDAVNCDPSCADNDGDTFFTGGPSCGALDCDDTDQAVYPGAPRICDGKDNNCDGRMDFPGDVDSDGDGIAVCAGDCDDNNPARFPGNLEHTLRDNCSDFIDNDCDSLIDSKDQGCAPRTCTTKTSPKNPPHFFTLLNPDGTVHPDNSRLTCEKCHAADFKAPIRYACQRCHGDPDDHSDPLNGLFKAQLPLDPPFGFGSAPVVRIHESTVVGTKYGNWTMGQRQCVVCHNPHAQEQNNVFGSDYGKYIKEYLCYDNDVTGQRVEEVVEFTSDVGAGSFADGPPHNANVCEMCHTRTNHHQRDGTAPGGQSHLDGEQCTFCHVHSDGFLPTAAVATDPHNTDFFNANCQLCHAEVNNEIEFRIKIPDSTCQNCHGVRKTHTSDTERNEFSTGKYTYNIMCVDCHNPMLPVQGNRKLLRPFINFDRADGSGNVNEAKTVNTTRRGDGSLGDGAPFQENSCNACHSLTEHNRFDGQNGGVHADGTDRTGAYCMICHDHNRSFMVPGKTCKEENVAGISCEP